MEASTPPVSLHEESSYHLLQSPSSLTPRPYTLNPKPQPVNLDSRQRPESAESARSAEGALGAQGAMRNRKRGW